MLEGMDSYGLPPSTPDHFKHASLESTGEYYKLFPLFLAYEMLFQIVPCTSCTYTSL
jgi:hypothetical protein